MKAINAMELAMEGLKEIQTRFYRDFPPHPQEKVYGFATPSTMKPTQWCCKLWNLKHNVCLMTLNVVYLLQRICLVLQIQPVESTKSLENVPSPVMSGYVSKVVNTVKQRCLIIFYLLFFSILFWFQVNSFL